MSFSLKSSSDLIDKASITFLILLQQMNLKDIDTSKISANILDYGKPQSKKPQHITGVEIARSSLLTNFISYEQRLADEAKWDVVMRNIIKEY